MKTKELFNKYSTPNYRILSGFGVIEERTMNMQQFEAAIKEYKSDRKIIAHSTWRWAIGLIDKLEASLKKS